MKLTSRYVPMTATEMFKLQAKGVYESIRAQGTGYEHIPPQFGGLEGQRITLRESEVVEVTDFEGDK